MQFIIKVILQSYLIFISDCVFKRSFIREWVKKEEVIINFVIKIISYIIIIIFTIITTKSL